MATNSNQKRTVSGQKKTAGARKDSPNKMKVVIFGIEIVVILIMLLILCMLFWPAPDNTSTGTSAETTGEESKGGFLTWLVEDGPFFFVTKGGILSEEGPKRVELKEEELAIPQEIIQQKEEGGAMHGYLNIALFGVDATKDKELYKGSRSDSTMIASINMDTGDIKLVSVYRDTYLNIGTDEYNKCNKAYFDGGAEQAVKMLNMNLDMDITHFVTVNYAGLRDVIDGLGGVYIDIDSTELKHINNYQIGIADVLKCEYTPVTETGMQRLNGLQAAAYCRIRYGGGDDYKRTARQREVIKAIEAQAKQADYATLSKVFNSAVDDIYTSLDNETILDLLKNIANYRIVDEGGFPEETMRSSGEIGAKGDCVLPIDLESNVVWLHQFLFEDESYSVTDSVKEYSNKIAADIAKQK